MRALLAVAVATLLAAATSVRPPDAQASSSHYSGTDNGGAGASPGLSWYTPRGAGLANDLLANDLAALVKKQRSDSNWLSVFFMSYGVKRATLNAVYSQLLTSRGAADNFIVVAVDTQALRYCLQLRLPCYNMTASLSGPAHKDLHQDGARTFSAAWKDVNWSKIQLLVDLLEHGVHIHYSDVDVVYFRGVYEHVEAQMKKTRADGLIWESRPVNRVQANCGVFFLENNQRTRKLARAWLAAGRLGDGSGDGSAGGKPPRTPPSGNQPAFNALHATHFSYCADPVGCHEVKEAGRAALSLQPYQFPESLTHRDGKATSPPVWDLRGYFAASPCHPRTVFVHVTFAAWNKKPKIMDDLRMWLVEEDGKLRFNDTVPHPYLPCPKATTTTVSGLE